MTSNYYFFKKLSFISLMLMSLGLTFGQTHLSDFEEHESKIKELRKEYEKTHQKELAQDQATRIANYQALQKNRKKNQRITGTESLANGQVTGQWAEKGANNVAGRIQNVDYDATTGAVYALSDGGNVWKGNLNGTSWTCLNNQFKFKGANYIKVIPNGSTSRILVCAPGDKYVYYTDNDGATWSTSTGLSAVVNWGWSLKTVVANDANRTVYFLTVEWNNAVYVSVYRSSDKGTSFSKIKTWLVSDYDTPLSSWKQFNITSSVNTQNVHIINRDSVFTVSPSACTPIYKHNLTLPEITRSAFTSQTTSGTSTFYLNYNNKLYAGTSASSSWVELSTPSANAWGMNSLSTSLSNANTIYFGDIEAYKGVRSGNSITWTKVNGWGEYYANNAGKLHADIPAFVPFTVNSQEQLFICTDGGLYKSTDNLATVQNLCLTGMNNAQYYSVYTNPTNTNYVFTGSQDQGMQQSVVGGNNFTQLASGDNGRYTSTNHNNLWHTGYSVLYYFPNSKATNPSSYAFDHGNRANINSDPLWMPYIIADPSNENVMYMGGGKYNNGPTEIIKFTYDGNYSLVPSKLPYNFSAGGDKIGAIGISKINTNYWYVLMTNGKFFSSTNGGTSFTMNSSFTGPESHYFYGSTIITSTKTLGTLYIAGNGYNGNGVYKSTNHGSSFTSITNGLPSTMVYDLAFNADESLIFAATEVGAYVYVVADNAWYPMIGNGGTDQIFWDVEFVTTTNTARFATYGRGIWDFTLSGAPQNQAPTISITAPTNNATFTAPASISITANATDTDGTISKVEFFNGTTKLGEDLTSPYAFSWTNVAAGSYTITAKATDNGGLTTTSSVINITVNPAAGGCSEPQYVAGTTYATGTNVQNGGKKYNCTVGGWCSSTSAWAYEPGVGTYWQQAWTEVGVCTGGTNQAPSVSITAPTNNATFTAPATVSITANATDADGTISKVEFFNGATKLGEDLTSPYSFSWTSVAAGSYSITAKATDNAGAVTTSSAINITVNSASNQAPSVSITAPTNNATFTAPATISITANATDTDGTISKVEFFNGATKLGEDLTSPYAFSWTSVAAGSYSITAKATDNAGLTTTSTAINITVTSGGTCSAPAWISGNAYSGGAIVEHQGIKYKANWWTQDNPATHNGPSGSGQPWTSLGACTSRIAYEVPFNQYLSIAPNPVTNNATIFVNLPENDKVEISVVGQLGQKVGQIFNGELTSGNYEFNFNGSDLANGMYILILKGEKGTINVPFVKQ